MLSRSYCSMQMLRRIKSDARRWQQVVDEAAGYQSISRFHSPFLLISVLSLLLSPPIVLRLCSLIRRATSPLSHFSVMDANISPAGPAPPGVVPDLVHPDSFASVSVGTMTTFIVVTSVAIAIKLFTKIHIVGKVSIDDCTYLPWPFT